MAKKEKIKENNKENDKILIILIVILSLIAVVLIVVKLLNGNNMDINDPLVADLHNYFSTDDLGNCNGLFNYGDGTVNYDNTDMENKLCLAYHKADITSDEKVSYDATNEELCQVDGMTFRVEENTTQCQVQKIKKDDIDSAYKKLFGKDIENNQEFKIDNFHICFLHEDEYYCGLSEILTYTIGNESSVYRIIEKAVEKGSNIEIYDYFVKVTGNTCYKTYITNTENVPCTKEYTNNKKVNYRFLQKYGTQFKHTYAKAEDGSYYWVSTEAIDLKN